MILLYYDIIVLWYCFMIAWSHKIQNVCFLSKRERVVMGGGGLLLILGALHCSDGVLHC